MWRKMDLVNSLTISVITLCFTGVVARRELNTIGSEISRATPYSPRVIDKTCLLVPDPGPCRANISMYFYDPASTNCSFFNWGGCQGNGNRFDTLATCLDTCLTQPNPPKVRPKYCALSFDYGYCFGALYRWYYDSLWKVCKQTLYSGCGGNKNNFYNIEQCESVCRFGNGYISVTNKYQGNKKKILIINPWQHTKTTVEDTTNVTRTTCIPVGRK